MDNQQVSNLEKWRVYRDTQYEISNHGNVRFYTTKQLKYTNVNKQGYRIFQYKVCGKRITVKIHRAVAELFLPPPSRELIDKCRTEHWKEVLVKHLDNDKLNNHFSNLEWSDLEGNTVQAWGDGLIKPRIGEDNGRAVLTEDLVHSLCKDFEEGMMPKEAVEKYGISRQQARKIRAGYAWSHISKQYKIEVQRKVKTSTTRA